MRWREHLSCNAKGHRYACKVQAACLHSGDNRHDDGNMSLRHTSEHTDDEADAGDDNGHRQRRILEGRDDFMQHLRYRKNLDEVKDAEHIEEHLHINCAADNFLETDLTLAEMQHEEESRCNNAHANRGVHIEEDNKDEGEHDRRE